MDSFQISDDDVKLVFNIIFSSVLKFIVSKRKHKKVDKVSDNLSELLKIKYLSSFKNESSDIDHILTEYEINKSNEYLYTVRTISSSISLLIVDDNDNVEISDNLEKIIRKVDCKFIILLLNIVKKFIIHRSNKVYEKSIDEFFESLKNIVNQIYKSDPRNTLQTKENSDDQIYDDDYKSDVF